MEHLTDSELLTKIASIFSQQDIADQIGHPREVVNRWLKEKRSEDWLVTRERRTLEQMLPSPNDNDDFTFIDLFAGIGGIRKGFEKAGGQCVFTSEYDKYAVKTYLANYYTEHDVHGDIREITQPSKNMDKRMIYRNINKMIPDHDVLLAGFPCQPFSIAGVSKKNALGRAHGFECDTQGTLFFDVARIIDAKKPVAVMLENVKNLKSHDKGNTFRVITETLDELGYEIADLETNGSGDPKVIDGSLFVPQHRERIVIVAFRKDLNVMQDFTLKKIKRLAPKKPPIIGDILEKEKDVDDKYILTPKLWKYLKDYAIKHKAKGNGFGFGKVTRKDRTSRTLSARYYKDGSEILVDRGSKRPRRLTPAECSRLMGFDKPGESKFVIPVSDTQAYKQFGNSVVVPVFSAVAKLMKPYVMEGKLVASGKKKPKKRPLQKKSA